MPDDSSFLSQQRTIDMLMGALETERFLATVLLHQLSDELTSHIAKCPTPEADYERSMRSTLAEVATLDPRRSDFRARMHSVGSAFREKAHLIYADAAAAE